MIFNISFNPSHSMMIQTNPFSLPCLWQANKGFNFKLSGGYRKKLVIFIQTQLWVTHVYTLLDGCNPEMAHSYIFTSDYLGLCPFF